MPVPTLISDLTTNPATNSPAGSESAKGVVDDYLRVHAAFIAQLAAIVQGPTVTLPSAGTVNIGFAGSLNIAITGSTTITGFDAYAEGTLRYVTFSGAMTLTHNAAVLVLPGAANILTVSGDVGVFKSNGSGKWTCMVYQRQAGYVTAAQVTATLAGSPAIGTALLGDGSLATPALAFSADTNTGIYRIGSDQLGVVCGGVLVGVFKTTGFESIKLTQTT